MSTSASRDLPFAAGSPLAPGESAVVRGRKRARLGRNLLAAVAVGLGLGVVILGPLLLARHAFVGTLALAAAIAVLIGAVVLTFRLRPGIERDARA